MSDDFRSNNTCGYGSLRSQGRRKSVVYSRATHCHGFKCQTATATTSRSRRGFRARFGLLVQPSSIRGRGECRMPDAPAASCAHGVTSMHTSIHSEPPESPGIPARDGFNSLYRALPGDRLSCHRRQRSCLHRLDTSVGVSGPHVFAVRKPATSSARRYVHRIPPQRPVTFAKRPSEWDGMARNIQLICAFGKPEYFFKRGWTRNRQTRPTGKSPAFAPLHPARRNGFATGAATGRIVFHVLRSQSRSVWLEAWLAVMSP
jgi:hypothetical protein